jgi:hypothetical protein
MVIPTLNSESAPKSIFLPLNHYNTKSHQNKFMEFKHFVQFGVLEIWWHFIISNFSEQTQFLRNKKVQVKITS